MRAVIVVLLISVVAGWQPAALGSERAAARREEARRNFFDPDQRARKFQSSETIFPTRTVHHGEFVRALPRARRRLDPGLRYSFRGERYSLQDFNERTNTNALLILKEGRLVTEIYRNGSDDSTRFISFSTGKSVTSTLVGMALEDGFIGSLDDRLTKYLPALQGSAYADVRIRDALEMSSGVDWNEESYDWNDRGIPMVRLWYEAMVEQRYRFVEGANTLGKAHAPAEQWNYSTMDASILGWLVENATRRRLSEYMQERLWKPAGMERDARWILDGPPSIGREMAGGMLLASLRDFGRFGQMMLDEGRVNGEQLVSADWVRAASRPQRPAVRYGMLYEGSPQGYGYQWWLFDNGRYTAEGVYGQFIYIAPDEHVVIVKLSYWPEAWVDALEEECYAFFNAVIDSLH